jgi:AcrR family transcriptional regulator
MPKVIPEYKEQATQKILEAARSVFAEKGYHEARMEDIAETVGVSKRTLYLYFENKEELFAAICAEAPKTMQLVMDSTIGNVQNIQDFARLMEDLFDKLLENKFSGFGPGSINEIRLNYEMILAASRNPTLKKIIRESTEKQVELLTDLIQNLKQKGAVRAGLEPSVLARAFFALYPGLIADIIVGVDKSEVRKTWIETIRILVGEAPVKK